ncbi:MAG: Do family serine endopeptidase, partial [Fibrobacter sp.]|nr:Do family serine endopeptidase [Fibrobacter sp.]
SVVFGAEKKNVSSKAAQINEVRSVFADIAEEVVPTVVQVIPTKIDTVTFSNNPFYQFFGNSPFGFEDFFGGAPRQRQPQVEKREYRQQGLGSGVIVSKDGYILTNHHVVKGADEIEVKTSDNRSFQADVVGMDSLSDVAVIKIKNDVKDLPVAYLGDSDKLRPGDWALAIGNPFSLSSSVTMGIISALGRTAGNDANSYQNFIQTDAAINPGNSGGALVNIDGELIGINTMIYTKSGGNMGIGFAIPINMAKKIMEDLIYEGKVSRGWLGVMIQELDYNTREALGINDKTQGVLIGDVFKNQPADKAGIKRGDIVLSINNKTVGNTNELKNVVAGISPGKKVPVVVLRNNKKVTLSVLLTGRDESQTNQSVDTESKDNTSENASDFSKLLGIKAGNITPELQSQLDLDKNIKGIVILGIEQGSQAQREGLAQNDIVLEINRQATPSIKEFKKISGTIKPGDSVLFLIQRDGSTFFKAFKVKK